MVFDITKFYEQHRANPSTNASDYYFQLDNTPNGDCFTITPKVYFDNTGSILDLGDGVPQTILPDGFCEMMEGVYEYDGDCEQGKSELISRGFVEKRMFEEFEG